MKKAKHQNDTLYLLRLGVITLLLLYISTTAQGRGDKKENGLGKQREENPQRGRQLRRHGSQEQSISRAEGMSHEHDTGEQLYSSDRTETGDEDEALSDDVSQRGLDTDEEWHSDMEEGTPERKAAIVIATLSRTNLYKLLKQTKSRF